MELSKIYAWIVFVVLLFADPDKWSVAGTSFFMTVVALLLCASLLSYCIENFNEKDT